MFRFLIILISIFYFGCQGPINLTMQPKVQAPFEKLDTLVTNDWWNREKNPIIDLDVPRNEVIAFGIYTVSNDVLKLTSQFFPLFPNESRDVRLAIKKDGKWEEIATEKINDIGWNASFRVENWDSKKNIAYKILHGTEAFYEGLIRAQPSKEKEFVLAALSCNSNKDRGNRENYVRNLNEIDPDLIFFAGDQSYDHREHTAAWIKFGMQFRETFRTRPCITIPDDHDIGPALGVMIATIVILPITRLCFYHFTSKLQSRLERIISDTNKREERGFVDTSMMEKLLSEDSEII